MGLIRTIKWLLPVSSRSYHERTDRIEDGIARIEQEMGGIERSVDEIAGRLSRLDDIIGRLDGMRTENATFNAQQRIYLEALFRHDGETHGEARRRLFAGIESARGDMRLSQNATARLMSVLDGICTELGIDYWFAYGTLVGTLTRNGFIPWDDDIDICMMREDVERLRAYLDGNPDYQITVVYDRIPFCKQIRFSSTDPLIPCFIDVEPWDWAVDASKEHDDAMRALRLQVMADLSVPDGLEYWAEFPHLFEPGSGYCIQVQPTGYDRQDAEKASAAIEIIQGVFDRYADEARDRGILCNKENARGMAYGLENIYDAPWRRTIWERDTILPTHRHDYEGYSFLVPNDAEGVAEECYPGYPFLSNTMLQAGHFSHDILNEQDVRDAMKSFVENGEQLLRGEG